MHDQYSKPNKEDFHFLRIRNNDGPALKNYLPYEDAKRWVTRLGLESSAQWLYFSHMKYKKGPLRGMLIKPRTIPTLPDRAYTTRKSWNGYNDFIGKVKFKPVYYPYDKAVSFARALKLTSAKAWREWHRLNKPEFLPKHPQFVYEEWTVWAHFLGTRRVHYSKKIPFSPFNEAIRLVHRENLKTKEEYVQWVKDEYLINLPLQPDSYYPEWRGWSHFLGKTVVSRIITEQTVLVPILYIARYDHHPTDVFEIKIEPRGQIELELRQSKKLFSIVKMYAAKQQDLPTIKAIVQKHCSVWWHDDSVFVVNNLFELLFQLDILLYAISS